MVVLIGFVILLFLLLVWVRAFYGSRDDFLKGEALLKEGQTIRAITFFDRSIHWYTPLNPYVQKSAERLWQIGEKAEQTADPRLAVIAFSTIRSGFYGASHLVIPGQDWIQKVDAKLLELGAAGKDVRDPHPNPLWSVAVVTSFIGWVGSLTVFTRWFIGREEGPNRRRSRGLLCLSLGVFFFGLWILGMAFA